MNITKSCLHRVWECFAAFSAKERALKQTLFCRTSFMEHFHFYTNLKFNWEILIFHLCPNVAIFLKNVFIFKDRTLKKNNIERTRNSMWFGRENDENVIRTRDWCGWPSSPPPTVMFRGTCILPNYLFLCEDDISSSVCTLSKLVEPIRFSRADKHCTHCTVHPATWITHSQFFKIRCFW